MNASNVTAPTDIAASISDLAAQLQEDLESGALHRPPYADIREMRRSLETLERLLREGPVETIGDAC